MYKLTGLEGVKKKLVSAVSITKGNEISKILEKKRAATAAGSNGAINIWKDDAGNIRCNAMQYCSSVEKITTNSVPRVEKWINKWLKKIN